VHTEVAPEHAGKGYARTLADYRLIHLLFEIAVTTEKDLRARWLASPNHTSAPSHVVQEMMAEPLDLDRLDHALEASWIQTLTWKLPEDAVGSETVTHLLGGI